jgi:hypothetical protein
MEFSSSQERQVEVNSLQPPCEGYSVLPIDCVAAALM